MRAPPSARPRVFALRALWIVAVLLPLAALGATGLQAWSEVRQEATDRVRRAVDMLHEHALRAFETQEIAIAATESRLRDRRWEDLRTDRDFHDFLMALDLVTLAAGGVAVIDPQGNLASASAGGFPTPAFDLSSRDVVVAHPAGSGAREAPFIGSVVVGQATGIRFFSIARPRLREDGMADGGVITAALWPHYFEAFYRSVMETTADTVVLFRMDGAVLASVPTPEAVNHAALPRGAAPMLQQLRRGPSGMVAGPSPIDGVPRLTAFRRLATHDAGVAYGLSLASLREAWRRRMAGPLAGALLAMVLLGALTWQAQRALTARALAEARSRTAERQATLGLLAGGLAHDFGNITQSVQAASVLLRRHAENPARVREIAGHLGRHAERATALSRRMLDTARRNGGPAGSGEAVDVADSLRELVALLDATLGAGIRVRCDVPLVLRGAPGIDRAELETALINLAANARDAMPSGGELRFSAERVDVPPRLADAPDLPTGRYIRLTVTDTGEGMDAATIAQLGEPFFTTKPEGVGTGLGFAMVRAFVRGAGGAVAVDSTPGQGSSIHLLLPAA